jgi:hypothetical protein
MRSRVKFNAKVAFSLFLRHVVTTDSTLALSTFATGFLEMLFCLIDHLCGLVVRVSGYRS